MDVPKLAGRPLYQQNTPHPLGANEIIPALRVPATFATYTGPVKAGAIPPIPSALTGFKDRARRRASIGQARTMAAVALARASHNARMLTGGATRTVGVRPRGIRWGK